MVDKKALEKTHCIFAGKLNNEYYVISTAKSKKVQEIFSKEKFKEFDISEVRELFLRGMLLNDLLKMECIYDTGFLEAIKNITELIRSLKPELQRAIDFIILNGSKITGKAKETSDIDIMVVFRDMATGITTDQIREEIVSKKLNIDPLVTFTSDAWVDIRNVEALQMNYLENGLPVITSPTIQSWRTLLKKGEIFPSENAIKIYLEQAQRTSVRLIEQRDYIMNEIIYWGVVRLMQASFMKDGLKLPLPSDLYVEAKKAFVEDKKTLTLDDIQIVKDVIDIKRKLKHKQKSDISFTELSDLEKRFEQLKKKLI